MKAAIRTAAALAVALAITSSAPIHALSGSIPLQPPASARSGEKNLHRGSRAPADPVALPREFLCARGTLLLSMDGVPVEVELAGTAADLLATSGAGEAADTDFDGLDQVGATFVGLNLGGTSAVGNVLVRLRSASLSPNLATVGEIEEVANNTLGTLDLPPFSPTGSAQGTYVAYLEVEIAGIIYHNELPMGLAGLFSHTPPLPGEEYQSQNSVQLYDEDNAGTRHEMSSFSYMPVSWLVMLPLVLRN